MKSWASSGCESSTITSEPRGGKPSAAKAKPATKRGKPEPAEPKPEDAVALGLLQPVDLKGIYDVSILNKEGAADRSSTARRILSLLLEQLK